ncbi:hypothetical protein QZH41_004322 [Actinostola sp. cb2023]|nr:hypothetical protein QZH41_004322 [Actinostola sp. cb2023]
MLSEFNQEHLNSYINNQAFCKEKFHEKNKLEYYCKTCVKSICQKCAATTHSTHDKVSVEEAAEDAKKVIRRDMNRLNPLKEQYIKELQLSKQNMSRFENEINAAKKKVDDEKEAQMKILQDHHNATMRTLDEMLHEHRTTNEEEQSELNTGIQQFADFQHQCHTMEEKNLTLQILENYRTLQEICNTLLERKSILSTKPVKHHYCVDYQLPMKYVQELGKIVESVTDPSRCSIECVNDVRCGFVNQFRVVTRNAKGQVCCTNKGSIDAQIKDVDGNEVENEVTENETGKYNVTYRAEKPSPYTILVSIGGKAIKNSPQQVQTTEVRAEIKAVRVFGKETTAKRFTPTRVTLSDSGEILAITDYDNHNIVIFTVDGKYVREIGVKGTGDGALCFPCGAVFNENRIFVIDNPHGINGRIQEFGLDGTYLRTVYQQNGVVLKHMCVTNHNFACLELYITDANKTNIKLFTKETGHFVKGIEINPPVINPLCPLGFAYHSGKYFISYQLSYYNCICVFDENGVLLYKFGENGKRDGEFDGVAGLAVYGADMILVCYANYHRVQVFTHEGDFISSFGSHGSRLGQMNGPMDVAVTPDGKVIVVAEYTGSRVQIWQ